MRQEDEEHAIFFDAGYSAVAGYLAVAVPGQIVKLFIATFNFYFVAMV